MSASLSDELKSAGRERVEGWLASPLLAGVARGDLPLEHFRYYLEQDYLYLREYARLYSRLAGNAPDEHVEHLVRLAANVITVEVEAHRRLGERFGCDFDAVVASAECAAYIAFLREASTDFGEGLVAALPCLWGYGVALRLVPRERSGPYRLWLEVYAGDDYEQMITRHCQMLDEAPVDPVRAAELFDRALDHEDAFWAQQPKSAGSAGRP